MHTSWFIPVCLAIISVAPWLFTSRAWVWWPFYALLAYVTYCMSINVITVWANYLAGNSGAFQSWPAEYQFSMVNAPIEALFLVAQIIVLPFYRKLSIQTTRPDFVVPA